MDPTKPKGGGNRRRVHRKSYMQIFHVLYYVIHAKAGVLMQKRFCHYKMNPYYPAVSQKELRAHVCSGVVCWLILVVFAALKCNVPTPNTLLFSNILELYWRMPKGGTQFVKTRRFNNNSWTTSTLRLGFHLIVSTGLTNPLLSNDSCSTSSMFDIYDSLTTFTLVFYIQHDIHPDQTK